MSKERLEEIKETLKKAEQWELDIWSKESGYDYVEIYLDDVVDIIDSIKILEKQNKRYREVINKAIKDLKNECLWDALVKLKALEGESDE